MDFKKLEDEPKPRIITREVGICDRCDGILIAQDSMKRGMGPTCWHKAHAANQYQRLEAEGQMPMFPQEGARP